CGFPFLSYVVSVFPRTTIFGQQLISLFRSPSPGFVIRKVGWRFRAPGLLNRLDHSPAGFNLISALEESSVAHHAVMQQSLVTGARCVTEIIFVIKVHIDWTNFHCGTGNLCAEAYQDSFVRLNVENKSIRGQSLNGSVSKHDERRALEANCDFRIADSQPFSGAQIERNIRPTPVIDQQFERDESLSG